LFKNRLVRRVNYLEENKKNSKQIDLLKWLPTLFALFRGEPVSP